jgi:hypothetical protein
MNYQIRNKSLHATKTIKRRQLSDSPFMFRPILVILGRAIYASWKVDKSSYKTQTEIKPVCCSQEYYRNAVLASVFLAGKTQRIKLQGRLRCVTCNLITGKEALVHATETYGGVKVYFHQFLTSTADAATPPPPYSRQSPDRWLSGSHSRCVRGEPLHLPWTEPRYLGCPCVTSSLRRLWQPV